MFLDTRTLRHRIGQRVNPNRMGSAAILKSPGSDSLSVQSVGKGRTEPPEIAWGSDIFSRVVHDVIQCSPAGPDSYAFSASYGVSWP